MPLPPMVWTLMRLLAPLAHRRRLVAFTLALLLGVLVGVAAPTGLATSSIALRCFSSVFIVFRKILRLPRPAAFAA